MTNIKSTLYVASFALLLTLLYSCEKEKTGKDVYQGCCDTEAVSRAGVFISNIFTPNGDGWNDFFHAMDTIEILYMEIYDREENLLFAQEEVIWSMPAVWNGEKPDGSTYKGLFNYPITIRKATGEIEIIEGQACSVVCDDGDVASGAQIQNTSNCFPPSQHDGMGGIDTTLPTGEREGFRCY